MGVLRWLCFLVMAVIIRQTLGQFSIPEVKLIAYEPEGLQVYIKALPGMEMFGFHGKVNEQIRGMEPGDISVDVKSPDDDGFFRFYDPSVKLKIGDKISYWIFVQHDSLGYPKVLQSWTVRELKKRDSQCATSITKIPGEDRVCAGDIILEDNFQAIDSQLWIVEQYVPGEPDYEFVVYRNDPNTVTTRNGKLEIIPTFITDESKLYEKAVDVTSGCTRNIRKLCYRTKYVINNPVNSGRITSKKAFAYGEVEIRARLPSGDWIFPEIYLEESLAEQDPTRIVIAYSRGNQKLIGNENDDIGGSLLFGGPILALKEPEKSKYLSTYRNNGALFSDDFHTYKLIWKPDIIELYLDGNKYGQIEATKINSDKVTGKFPNQYRLVLGVGVAGNNDFPDGYKSGEFKKPWVNEERLLVKNFQQNSTNWYPSWTSKSRLEVEYVKIRAI